VGNHLSIFQTAPADPIHVRMAQRAYQPIQGVTTTAVLAWRGGRVQTVTS